MINRRLFNIGALLTPGILVISRSVHAELPDALSTSKLVYLTPIKSDGNESSCKGEVWFMLVEGDIYVVTQSSAWRAEAIRNGLTTTKMWVGEFGNWRRASDKFREAPEIKAVGSIVEDNDVQSKVLEAMGKKYSDEWPTWGPRFKNALADGSRVMLRYKPST